MQLECRRLLASPQLCRAAQSSRLLSFLVDTAAGGVPGALNEYAIGLAVFGRDAASYSTGEDPIVRVQMGRLRAKLADIYAGEGRQGARWQLDIPVGSYVPRLLPCAPVPVRIAFVGLDSIGHAPAIALFARGLAEELRYRLHRQFGALLAVTGPEQRGAEQLRQLGVGFVLDGSVRDDASTVRTAFRLLNLVQGRLAWSEQIDHAGDLSIQCQERLAAACCAALREVLAT